MLECLFNLEIADLDCMLNGNGGAEFDANRISGVFYMDDIHQEWAVDDVLFTKNEQNL